MALAATSLPIATLDSQPDVNAERAELGSNAVLQRVTVSASALELTPMMAAQHVTVLTRGQILAAGYTNVADLLGAEVGLFVDKGQRSGGFASLYLRGADPSHVVVLIDGVRQNDSLSSRGSAVDLSSLTLGDVEWIEIVRGNVSVSQGEALAGLIHIHTKAQRADALWVNAQVGGDGLRSVSAGVERGSWRVSATHSEDGSGNSLGSSRNQALNVNWSAGSSATSGASAQARVAKAESSGFPDDSGGERLAVRRTLETRSTDSAQATLRSWFAVGAQSRVELQASAFSRGGTEQNPGIVGGVRDPAGFPAITSDTQYRRQEAKLLWRTRAFDAWQAVAGVEFQRETGSFDSLISYPRFKIPARFDLARESVSVFGEARYDYTDWSAQIGIRNLRARGYGEAWQPGASMQHVLGASGTMLGASISSASKLPSFYALGHPLIGNAALRPERGDQREVFIASTDSAPVPYRLAAFSSRYTDLIDFESGPPPRLVNRSRISIDGVEARATYTVVGGVRVSTDGTWMRVANPESSTTLRSRPSLQAGARLVIPFTTGAGGWANGGQFTLSTRFVGRRLDSTIPTGNQWLPGYALVNTVANIELARGLRAALGVDNLLDRRVDETIGNWTGRRRVRLSVNWSL